MCGASVLNDQLGNGVLQSADAKSRVATPWAPATLDRSEAVDSPPTTCFLALA
jgi:hypothetical protein